jgi:hypothetical protein
MKVKHMNRVGHITRGTCVASNTPVVIDPDRSTVESTSNLTRFDEDTRPPFRHFRAGIAPAHAAMNHKPLSGQAGADHAAHVAGGEGQFRALGWTRGP